MSSHTKMIRCWNRISDLRIEKTPVCGAWPGLGGQQLEYGQMDDALYTSYMYKYVNTQMYRKVPKSESSGRNTFASSLTWTQMLSQTTCSQSSITIYFIFSIGRSCSSHLFSLFLSTWLSQRYSDGGCLMTQVAVRLQASPAWLLCRRINHLPQFEPSRHTRSVNKSSFSLLSVYVLHNRWHIPISHSY